MPYCCDALRLFVSRAVGGLRRAETREQRAFGVVDSRVRLKRESMIATSAAFVESVPL